MKFYFLVVLYSCPNLRKVELQQGMVRQGQGSLAKDFDFVRTAPIDGISFFKCDLQSPKLLALTSLPVLWDRLRALDLSGNPSLSEASLGSLRSFRSLEHLSLAQCAWATASVLADLALHLHHLRSLNLTGNEKVTDLAIRDLCQANLGLETLTLSNCTRLTDAGLEILPSLPRLDTLVLNYCRELTDTGVGLHLSRCGSLRVLDLASVTKLTDAGVLALTAQASQGSHLQVLNLTNCNRLTNKAFVGLVALVRLSELDLSYLSCLTDQILPELKRLRFLRKLILWQCRNITDEGLLTLARPNLVISRTLW